MGGLDGSGVGPFIFIELIRQRAESMAWTPGLVLDYARAMGAVIHPPEMLWRRLLQRRSAAA